MNKPRMNKPRISALVLALALAVPNVQAASISLINGDPAGVGLNETTAVAPVGGNPGRTVGAQRTIAYQYAMDLWGGVLESPVPIKVFASFAPLTCTATSGTLGQAGTNWLALLSDGVTNRVYPAALADALVGYDIHAAQVDDPADVFSQFNGSLGRTGCLEGMSWYYGLDGKTPAGAINFLNVVMHEIGHGLGVAGFLNKSSGALYAGYSDHYTRFAHDNVLDRRFEQMTNAERALAMRTPGRTVWTGSRVNAEATLILDKQTALKVSAPAAVAGSEFQIGFATFGNRASSSNYAGALVLGDDGVAPTGDGCTPFQNAAALAGKIAVVDRGTCGFADKVANAQRAGAKAVLVVNNAAGAPIDMGGATTDGYVVTIPSVMVSQADGQALKANLPATVSVGLANGNLLSGADAAGRVRLYAPTTVAGGSTFSHVDTAVAPNALMEPFDTPEVQSHFNVDVTPALFRDIGWSLNPGNGKIDKCDTGVDAVEAGGLIVGANLQAHSNLCAIQSGYNKAAYTQCMLPYAKSLYSGKVIGYSQYLSTSRCLLQKAF